MATSHMLQFVVFLIFFLFNELSWASDIKKFPLLMPNVHPDRDEFYVCTPIKIVGDKDFYIVGFEPNATMNVVHHMLLFGCSTPGADAEYWDCGEMADPASDNGRLKKASPCGSGSHVIYAWARNAKPLKLPDDVGFLVGKNTPIQYLVLQIHYSKKFPEENTDNSGLFLLYTEQPQSKLAAVLLLAVGGVIPPKSVTHMEVECRINERKTIYPFAYRTHTHGLGRVVSGYRVVRDDDGVDHWNLLGKRDPLTPQMFYPVFDKTPIKYGDRVAARCTMDSSSRDRYTEVGPTNNDEMCNFYLMAYVEEGNPLETPQCFKPGPPNYSWESDHLNNIPDAEASSLY
ncbi:peptidylglycine alpha-hydroxylating monooxygenase [Cylas formicarius]|uniref:peptidylglycine alpha-hydroxylating monooxygenase n=1 Tax=Cylas formicarius TaxID=197179 RepID=UPI0029587BC2|nr:peptidylglycine alpha-hydroxylating monooxygenase [Cylas formicarius]